MYTRKNFRTKADLKRALATGERIEIFSPGPFPAPSNGSVSLEGPHAPAAHSWYAEAEVKNGLVIKIVR